MAEQSSQRLIPIAGAGYSIFPEVVSLGKDAFATDRYAQKQGPEVLPLKAVYRTARAVKPEEPTKDFRKYARKVDEGLKVDEIDEAYSQLHKQILELYWIRAKEVLLWSRQTTQVHPRIVAGKETAQLKSTLLTNYRVPEDKDVFDISGIENPILEVLWPTRGGIISEELAKLFDADPTTFVDTNPDTNSGEGIRALYAGFRNRERPVLYSYRDPWYRNSNGGSLLGRKIQKK